jgi:hypothetical protein
MTSICPTCHGKRKIWRLVGGLFPWKFPCPTCNSSGEVPTSALPSLLATSGPQRSWFRPSHRWSTSRASSSTVRTLVTQAPPSRRSTENSTTATEVPFFDDSTTLGDLDDKLTQGEKPHHQQGGEPGLPLIVDPFAVGPPRPELQGPPAPDPQENPAAEVPEASGGEQGTAY